MKKLLSTVCLISVLPISAFAEGNWSDYQLPSMVKNIAQGFEDGDSVPITAKGLHPSHGSWQPILFPRLPEGPAPAWLQRINERQGQLLR